MTKLSSLEKENNELKAHVKRVESRLDSFKAQVKGYLGVTDDELAKSKRGRNGNGRSKSDSESKNN